MADPPVIRNADPQGADAMYLLNEAWLDARALYPELFVDSHTPPTNAPLAERAAYLVAYLDERPVACGALSPIDTDVAEVKRMYVHRDHRRRGLARAILSHLIDEARKLGYVGLALETGNRQVAAMRFYESQGFERIPAFGRHVSDPTSVCYSLSLASA